LFSPQFTRSVRRYWAPTAMTFFVNGVGFGGWAAQVPRAISRLQVDDGTFGLMLLGMGIGAVMAMIVSGRLIARYGAGPLIRVAMGLFLAAYIGLSTISDFWLFVAALLLFGAAGGLTDVAMNAYASDVERHMNWRVMASFHGMWSMGGLIGAALVSYMLSVFSDLTQALTLSIGLLALFMTCQHGLVALAHHVDERSARRLSVGRAALILGILAAICFSAEGAVRDWSSLFLTREVHASIERAGWGFAAMSATMALCRFSGDWMRLQFGERQVMISSTVVAIGGFLLAVLSGDHLLSIAGFGLVGIGLSNTVPILISAAGRTSTPGASIAFAVSFGYAGLLASPPLLGFIASRTSLATMFLIVAASCVAITVGWKFLPAEKAG
jgi:MFS family permease